MSTGDTASHELRIVTTLHDVAGSLRTFNREAVNHPARTRSLLRQTSYWVYDPDHDEFGPAKFVGFAGMSFGTYELAINSQLTGDKFDGHVTRTAIEYVVGHGFEDRPALHAQLNDWGARLLAQPDV